MSNKYFFLIGCAGMLLLGACSPRLSSSILTSYPALNTEAPVAVFNTSKEVPASSEILGTLSVSDPGAATHCDSAIVFAMAIDEVRKVGGNALLITEYRKPSIWGSSCYQIAATILKVSATPKTVANITLSDTIITPDDVLPSEVSTALSNTEKAKKQRLLPRMTFFVDGGYAWRTAEISKDMDVYYQSFLRKMNSGPIWGVGGSYFFNDFNGLQLSYYGYTASHGELAQHNETGEIGTLKAADYINYVGVAYVMRGGSRNQKWLMEVLLGLGYIHWTNDLNFLNEEIKLSGASVGFETTINVEYRFTPTWGVALSAKSIVGSISSFTQTKNGLPTNVNSDGAEGLGQIGLTLGVRCHIK